MDIKLDFSKIYVFPIAETADFVYISFGEAFNFLLPFSFSSLSDKPLSPPFIDIET
jgi:hypothetical protein